MPQVRENEVWAALEECTAGATVVEKTHRKWIMVAGKTYRGFPSGGR